MRNILSTTFQIKNESKNLPKYEHKSDFFNSGGTLSFTLHAYYKLHDNKRENYALVSTNRLSPPHQFIV